LELAQLVRDVADVMATLTDEQRAFAEDLASRSKAEIAREMGIPRTTLSSRVRPALRPFEDAGLQDYVDSSPIHQA
jgi:RNA polymerase sigma-70 factor (ECF subfamily)